MRVELVLRTECLPELKDAAVGTYNRKSMESEWVDSEVINFPVGKTIDRVLLSDIQLGNRAAVDNVIKLLENTKAGLKN